MNFELVFIPSGRLPTLQTAKNFYGYIAFFRHVIGHGTRGGRTGAIPGSGGNEDGDISFPVFHFFFKNAVRQISNGSCNSDNYFKTTAI